MAEEKRLEIEYSAQSLSNALEIVAYLRAKFSQRETDNFHKSLNQFERLVRLFPTLYPESKKIKLRRAVLSKALSVYYTIGKNKIYVIAILDNRWDETSRLK